MAHQSHNLSYSKYIKLFDKLIQENINGSNNKILISDIDVLSNEFIENIKKFANTIKTQIINSKPYTEKEYNKFMKNNNFQYDINTEFYFWHLCEAISIGDIKLFSTILQYMKKLNQKINVYNFYYPGYGQVYLGGLCQVFVSFLKAYLLINTLLDSGYYFHEFWKYFKNTKHVNLLFLCFSNAFRFGCNTISDNFQEKYQILIEKIPDKYMYYNDETSLNYCKHEKKNPDIPNNISLEELKEMSKEMFRLMYTTYAILTINEGNEKEVNKIIKQVYYELFL